MFAELAQRFAPHKNESERKHVRREKPFLATYTLDHGQTWLPAYGLDLGPSGMCVLVQEELVENEVPMRLTLDSQVLPIRARPIWHIKGRYRKGIAHQYGLELVAASAEDRERIKRWIAGEPLDDVNRAQEQLKLTRLQPDDVNRLFPWAFQERLLSELVARGALAPFDVAHPPLVAYDYGGTFTRQDKTFHRLTIHSKVMDGDEAIRFTTRFVFDDAGEKITVIDDHHAGRIKFGAPRHRAAHHAAPQPNPDDLAEAAILRGVNEALIRDHAVDHVDVHVHVDKDTVKLTGRARTYPEKLAAGHAASRVHGVKRVVNDIHVTG